MTEPSMVHLLLLVEDEPLLRIETEDILKEQGFDVVATMNGGEGISELERS